MQYYQPKVTKSCNLNQETNTQDTNELTLIIMTLSEFVTIQ
jgi:hypothetical protein